MSNTPGAVVESARLAAMEALLAKLLARTAAQDREIAALRGTIVAMGPVREEMGNFHARLDELEAVAHRHEDGDGSEVTEDEDEDDFSEDQDACT